MSAAPALAAGTRLRILFDARKVRDFGVGTYIRNLLAGLGRIDTADRYVVIISPGDARELPALPPNF